MAFFCIACTIFCILVKQFVLQVNESSTSSIHSENFIKIVPGHWIWYSPISSSSNAKHQKSFQKFVFQTNLRFEKCYLFNLFIMLNKYKVFSLFYFSTACFQKLSICFCADIFCRSFDYAEQRTKWIYGYVLLQSFDDLVTTIAIASQTKTRAFLSKD